MRIGGDIKAENIVKSKSGKDIHRDSYVSSASERLSFMDLENISKLTDLEVVLQFVTL